MQNIRIKLDQTPSQNKLRSKTPLEKTFESKPPRVRDMLFQPQTHPIPSIYGICPYIWLIFMVSASKYAICMDPMGMGLNISQTETLPSSYHQRHRILCCQEHLSGRDNGKHSSGKIGTDVPTLLIFDGHAKCMLSVEYLAQEACVICVVLETWNHGCLKRNIFPSHIFGQCIPKTLSEAIYR